MFRGRGAGALAWALLAIAPTASAERFFRIIDGERPASHAEVLRDRFLYGTEVLYTGDAVAGSPTVVEGTVWHSNLNEARFFRGDRNPILEGGPLLRRLEMSKWEEARLLMEHLPEAFPRTENMSAVLRDLGEPLREGERAAALARLGEALRARYPNGFFLKPVYGFAMENFPTDRTDFASLFEAYRRDVAPRWEALARAGSAADADYELKWEKSYEGRVLEELFAHPEKVIIQERLRPLFSGSNDMANPTRLLVEEYRVHVVEGRVLRDATVHRWGDTRFLDSSALRKAEAFAARVLARLPEPMRRMSFGMDLMRVEGGGFKVIELNPGGESGYLYPETDVWVTQLLAERYLGRPTPFLREFRAALAEPTLDARAAAIRRLFGRPEVRELFSEDKPITELKLRIKESFVGLVRETPTPSNALDCAFLLQELRLGDYLTRGEGELLGGLLMSGGRSNAEVSALLGLGPRERLFRAPGGGARLLTGLAYGDEAAVLRLADLARGLRGAGRLEPAIERVVLERAATPAQLRARPELVDFVARDARGALAETDRLFYSGSRRALMAEILRLLRR